ncbi:YutD family protein [Paenibacillus rigui]|uniref:YutD family protein n=1 Tax=Paenibacillus rigui TaxID=554312 RepID=UPI001FE9CCFE|nr:YutD family protein [Paenibacillus rigui]
MIHIANRSYEVVVDHKNGWKPEAFRDRYSEVLERYDYIVGDWGYNQLRLRGFFKDTHPKATKESSIATLQDYLNEYCNFGCAYFIIEKVPNRQQNPNQPPDAAGAAEGNESEDVHINLEETVHSSQVAKVYPPKAAEAASTQPQQGQQPEAKQPQRERNHSHKDKPNHHHRRGQKQQSQGQAQNNGKSANTPKPQQHVKQ